MRVSAVCANEYVGLEQLSVTPDYSADTVTDTALSTFTSSLKNSDPVDMDSITEWKIFCQNRIMANNLDYIA